MSETKAPVPYPTLEQFWRAWMMRERPVDVARREAEGKKAA